ncbi:MAG TPA: tetratricopeptide repeat protein [Bacteroidia bacterium]|jgi:tetratricopeptide (TPR) repeat protein|nr:tetratricopeptide repeat protein [Bacteroidia bacterium]
MQITEQKNPLERFKLYILTGICLLTFFCYHRSLSNQFTDWDDNIYIKDDFTVKTMSWENVKTLFTETKYYYHPLTMLSFQLNYYFSKDSPESYYFVDILFHLANVILVFLLISSLFSRLNFVDKSGGLLAAYLAALWFGIHPMHVESVSWLAERKDVLYTFFYLLGLLSYLKYADSKKLKWYGITSLLFIASCLSKPMAVVFPLSLICIDLLIAEKYSFKILLDKIPILVIAFLLGLVNYHFQQQANTITPFGNIPVTMRFMFAGYGFVMYIVKFFAPIQLSTFYPYPCVNMQLHVDQPLPLFYYLSFWLSLLIVALPLYFSYKFNRNHFRALIFGIGFFFVNVMFELQFISSGMAIMADRYSYLSYIGLLFITVFFLQEIIKRYPNFKITVYFFIGLFTVGLAYLCEARTAVWQNTGAIFKNGADKYGDEASLFYLGLGNYYRDSDPKLAVDYYAKYARLNNDADILNDIGNLYKSLKDYPNAAKYYERLLQTNANPLTTYIKVSDAWATMGQTDSAVVYYKKAQAIDLTVANEYYDNIETALEEVKQFKNAINHYSIQIAANPENPGNYIGRGNAAYRDSAFKESIPDYLEAMKLDPKHFFAPRAFNLAVIYHKLGEDDSAYKYSIMARDSGQIIAPAFFNSLEKKKSIHPSKN